jgi:hypothetical protein
MGTVTQATLSAQYALRPERDAGGGFQVLASDYQVRVTRAEVELAPVALVAQAAAAGGGGGTFDPANPPPGYSLCHGGHCHADDGRLVDYEDIQAELSGGGGAQARTVLSLQPAQATVDLLAQPAPQALSCAQACTLTEGDIHQVRVPVRRLLLEGEVRDGRPTPRFAGTRPLPLSLLLETPAEGTPVPVSAEVELPVDRDSPPHLALTLSLTPGASLFDAVDFAALAAATTGPLTLSESVNAAAWEQVVAALAEQPLEVEVSRSTP